MKIEVDITKRYFLILLSIIVILIGVIGVFAVWDSSKNVWHSGNDVKITISGVDYSLQEAINLGKFGGGVKSYQNGIFLRDNPVFTFNKVSSSGNKYVGKVDLFVYQGGTNIGEEFATVDFMFDSDINRLEIIGLLAIKNNDGTDSDILKDNSVVLDSTDKDVLTLVSSGTPGALTIRAKIGGDSVIFSIVQTNDWRGSWSVTGY